MRIFNYIRTLSLSFIVGVVALTSCSDNVDDSNLYSFTGDVVTSYLSKDANFSDYCSLLKRVRLSNKSKSSLYDLLSTRGNYTCFAPTNEAIHNYADRVMEQKDYPLENLSDSLVSLICKNSIIDCGSESAYQTNMFEEGALSHTNMNERYVTIDFDTLNNKVSYVINSSARIVIPDNEVENGVVHVMDSVVTSSMADLPALMENIPNVKIFSRLLEETGWGDKMTDYLDQDYEENHAETGKPTWTTESRIATPEHRKSGYTAFVETDKVFQEKWGITPVLSSNGQIENWDQIKQVIEDKCSDMDIYAETSAQNGSPTDWKDPNNVVNQFVAYHLLDQSRSSNLLVVHMNEMSYNYKTGELSHNISENYVTLGQYRRLLRITEGKTTQGKRINRWSSYDSDTNDELTVMTPGLLISTSNTEDDTRYDNNALNGFYYPIEDILVYDKNTRDNVLNTRLRFDILSYTKEAASNGFLDPRVGTYLSIPNNYLSAFVNVSDETWIVTKNELHEGVAGWRDYMTNEYQVLGQYDVTFLLPPVPYDGTYELRWGMSNNPYRAMAQMYLGTDPSNLPAIGTPLDMRLYSANPSIGWVADDLNDPTVATENDKTLRNHGYMKAPKIFGLLVSNGPVTKSVRDIGGASTNSAMRKILWTGTVSANKKYYLRVKSVLSNPNGQFFTDYMEWVPKSVYAGTTPEDVW